MGISLFLRMTGAVRLVGGEAMLCIVHLTAGAGVGGSGYGMVMVASAGTDLSLSECDGK